MAGKQIADEGRAREFFGCRHHDIAGLGQFQGGENGEGVVSARRSRSSAGPANVAAVRLTALI